MRRFLAGCCLVALCSSASLVPAHDVWIELDTFRPGVGSVLQLRLQIGELFQGKRMTLAPERIEKLSLIGDAGERPVFAYPGDSSKGFVSISKAGLAVLAYQSKPSLIDLDAKTFAKHLAEKGLEKLLASRKEPAKEEKPVRERYSRYAKALVCCGDDPEKGFDRRLGFLIELVPQKDPFRLKPGEDLPIRILYKERPIGGILVEALHQGEEGAGARALSARSNDHGDVSFRLEHPGRWLVTAVHMIEARDHTVADWESYWASLTFEVPDPGGVGGADREPPARPRSIGPGREGGS